VLDIHLAKMQSVPEYIACASAVPLITLVILTRYRNRNLQPRLEINQTESQEDLQLIELEKILTTARLGEENIKLQIQSLQEKFQIDYNLFEEMKDERERYLAENFAWEEERREMHDRLMNLRGNIRVFCRIRPNLKGNNQDVIQMKSSSSLSIVNKFQRRFDGSEVNFSDFKFDKVYGPAASQEEVFYEIELLVQSALDGQNVCIFAYGQTGSGKSYTMEGPPEMNHDTFFYRENPARGIIPRAVRKIFDQIPKLAENGWTYRFKCSFIEVYLDKIYDLLGETRQELKIFSDAVKDLTAFPVSSVEQVEALMIEAKKKRKVGATNINSESSRSHFLFQFVIEGTNSNGKKCNGRLNLIDLAGSENLDAAKDEKQRLEGQKIRESLSFLKTVLMRLRRNSSANISFRDSKLTHLLKTDLSAGSKVLMLVNISPEKSSLSETKNSLNFAKSVNSVKPAGSKAKKLQK
jgi:kinesin family protein C1